MRVSFLLLAATALVAADRPSKGYGPPKYSYGSHHRLRSSALDTQIGDSDTTGNVNLGTEDSGSTPVNNFRTSISSFDSGEQDGISSSLSESGNSGFIIGDDDIGADFTNEDGDSLVIEGDNMAIGGESSDGVEGSQESSRPRRYRWYLSIKGRQTRGRYYTWSAANEICRRKGFVLLSIENAKKDRLVQKVLRKYRLDGIWTSGTKRRGKWVWANGIQIGGPFGYENWDYTGPLGQPQPNNDFGREYCLAVLNKKYNSRGIKWHDLQCDRYYLPFICEEKRF